MDAFSAENEALSVQAGHRDALAWEADEGDPSVAVTEKALDILGEDLVCFQTGPEEMPRPFPSWGRRNPTSAIPGRCLDTAQTLILPIKKELLGIVKASLLVSITWIGTKRAPCVQEFTVLPVSLMSLSSKPVFTSALVKKSCPNTASLAMNQTQRGSA